nr:uncharacterized mitochondrial protein AtMg00810-like [Tanacetum cinerariifolium]
MVAYLTKCDANEGFNQILDFLNGSSFKYALTVNLNIYVSCIKQFWTTVAVKKLAILRKFGLTDGKSASTPIDTEKPLLKDPNGEDIDMHTYRLMIGLLMYLTSSRPDIMFAICACAHFQVTLKASHLHAVKRIFRYLKGKPHLGLWYLKDSPFDLVAYSDSDYAGASLDKNSTTGGCQFLGCRLISWQCKKQTVVATSSTEAEYVVVLSSMESLKRMVYLTNILSAGYLTTPQIVLNSPCLTHIKNWLVQIKRSLNSVAERKHRHLVETARSFLLSADAPSEFWGEAFLTATHSKGVSFLGSSDQKLYTSRNVDFLEHIRYYSVPASSHNLTQTEFIKIDPFDNVPHEPQPVLSLVITEPVPKTTLETIEATSETTTSTETVVDRPPSGRPKRNCKSTKRDGFVYSCYSDSFSSFIAFVNFLHEPESYRDVVCDPFWQVAMAEELVALYQTQTSDLVPLLVGKRAIGS